MSYSFRQGPGYAVPPRFPNVTVSPNLDLTAHYSYLAGLQRNTGSIIKWTGATGTGAINADTMAIAARALVPSNPTVALAALNWFAAHQNASGSWNDWNVNAGVESDSGTADSEDGYIADFLSLAYKYSKTQGTTWATNNAAVITAARDRLYALIQTNGLTKVSGTIATQYTEDNSGVYNGLKAYAGLATQLGQAANASTANTKAAAVLAGLQKLCNTTTGWSVGVGFGAPNMATFYPDAVTQFFPLVLNNPAEDITGYQRFTIAFPNWDKFGSSTFPWLMAAWAAARAGDGTRVLSAYYQTAISFPTLVYPWNAQESAFLIRAVTADFDY